MRGRTATTMSVAASKQHELIQKARASLPLEKFLSVLSQVALNGTMPRFDQQGNIIPEDEPEPVQDRLRLETVRYLVDKVMANPVQALPAATEDDALDATAVRTLSNDQLRALAQASLNEVVTRSKSAGRIAQEVQAG